MKYRITATPCFLSIRSKSRMNEQTTYSVTLESLALGNGETDGETGGIPDLVTHPKEILQRSPWDLRGGAVWDLWKKLKTPESWPSFHHKNHSLPKISSKGVPPKGMPCPKDSFGVVRDLWGRLFSKQIR